MNTIIRYDNTKIEMFMRFLSDNETSILSAKEFCDYVIYTNDSFFINEDIKYTYYRLAWSFIKAGFIYKDGKWAFLDMPNMAIYELQDLFYNYVTVMIKDK